MVWPYDSYIVPSNEPPPPHGDVYFYADVPSSYTVNADGVITSGWGTATTVVGTPRRIFDSVTGQRAIRFATGDSVTTVAGAGDFLTTGESTVILVGRTLKFNNATAFPPIDTTAAGTGKGYQLQVGEFLGQHLNIRVNDGATWILDDSGLQGQFIEQKWFIAVARLTPTNWDLRVDGQFIAVGGTTISITLPGATTHPLSIGNGPFDILAIELYKERLSDVAVAAAETRLASRFTVDLLEVIGGDPTLTTNVSALFPYMSRLPGGKLYVTMFRGSDENPHDTNYIESRTRNLLSGSWSAPVTILQSDSSLRYSDVHTSEPLSDGQIFQHWFVYNSADAPQTYLQWRKSTSFDVDGLPVWGVTNDLPVAGVDWIASGAQLVENPGTPGQYHLPAFGMQTGDTHESVFDLKSTDSGASWTVKVVGDGEADGQRYAENAFVFDATDTIISMIRVVGGATAYVSRSTDAGDTWATPVNSTAGFISSAQGFKKLTGGDYISGPARVGGSFQESAMFWRGAGTLWNSAWTSPPTTPWVDPFFGGNYYGGNYEISPGVLALVYGRSSAIPQRNNVSTLNNFYLWYLTHAMPGDALPDIATVTASGTQVITLSGAGGYTCTFDTNESGANVVVSGEKATYTAGTINGTDVFHFEDCNGKPVGGPCSYTVTGGSAGWTPSILGTQVKAWFDPSDPAKRTLDSGHVVALIDKSSFGVTLAAADTSNAPGLAAAGITRDAVDYGNGVGVPKLIFGAGTFGSLTSAECYFVGKFPSATPGSSGFWSMGTDASGDYHPFAGNVFYDDFGSNARYGPSDAQADLSVPFVYSVAATASDWRARFNGTSILFNASNTVAWTGTPFLGRSAPGSVPTNMLMGEFIVVSPPLDDATRAQMLTYLQRWGTP